MNRELFSSMREQMKPGEEARAALVEKLAAPQKKRVSVGRYVAVAACAAVLIAAPRVYNFIRDSRETSIDFYDFHWNAVVEPLEPHSYVLADNLACWPEDTSATENSIAAGSSDEDQDMTPGELTDNMLEAGFTQEDVDVYLASGWQMTWAKWWKFYHLSEESGERNLETLLKFSQEEGLTVNTGEEPVSELPGGAFVSDAPDQSEAIMAYQNLMAQFEADYGPGRYPEWYGGAYIDEYAALVVNITAAYEQESKELARQVQDWAGSGRICFGSSRLSLNELRELQDKVVAAMGGLGLSTGCGVNEETGQVELTLPGITHEALLRLAVLDPEGTAILVIVGEVIREDLAEEPVQVAPSVSQSVQPGGGSDDPNTPVSNTPGVIADADGVIAWEPQGY